MNETSDRLNCPRCKLLLQEDEYEGYSVEFCGNCWGYWLSSNTLEQILEDHRYHFSKQERKTALQVMATQGDVDREGHEREPIACPACLKTMQRRRYFPECPVEIDQCAEHGVWLDTGELKELQIYFESKS